MKVAESRPRRLGSVMAARTRVVTSKLWVAVGVCPFAIASSGCRPKRLNKPTKASPGGRAPGATCRGGKPRRRLRARQDRVALRPSAPGDRRRRPRRLTRRPLLSDPSRWIGTVVGSEPSAIVRPLGSRPAENASRGVGSLAAAPGRRRSGLLVASPRPAGVRPPHSVWRGCRRRRNRVGPRWRAHHWRSSEPDPRSHRRSRTSYPSRPDHRPGWPSIPEHQPAIPETVDVGVVEPEDGVAGREVDVAHPGRAIRAIRAAAAGRRS